MRPDIVEQELKPVLSCDIQKGALLSEYGSWRIGGLADILVSPKTIEDVSRVQRYIHEHKIPSVVIGDGSNILFDSDGFRGIVIHIGRDLSEIKNITGRQGYCAGGNMGAALCKERYMC